jgi:hypothetical protein
MGAVAVPEVWWPSLRGGAGVAGLIGPRPLAALRVAATLAHRLPVQVRVRSGGQVVVEVARSGGGNAAGGNAADRTLLTACQFRAAVAEAWGMARAGKAVAMRGLRPGEEPTVDVGLPPGACGRPGGLWRFPADGGFLWVAAAVGPPDRLWIAADPDLCIGVDEATGVVVASAWVDDADDEAGVVDTLEGLVAELSVGALIADLTGRAV